MFVSTFGDSYLVEKNRSEWHQIKIVVSLLASSHLPGDNYIHISFEFAKTFASHAEVVRHESGGELPSGDGNDVGIIIEMRRSVDSYNCPIYPCDTFPLPPFRRR